MGVEEKKKATRTSAFTKSLRKKTFAYQIEQGKRTL